jgi:hypothetical protein
MHSHHISLRITKGIVKYLQPFMPRGKFIADREGHIIVFFFFFRQKIIINLFVGMYYKHVFFINNYVKKYVQLNKNYFREFISLIYAWPHEIKCTCKYELARVKHLPNHASNPLSLWPS